MKILDYNEFFRKWFNGLKSSQFDDEQKALIDDILSLAKDEQMEVKIMDDYSSIWITDIYYSGKFEEIFEEICHRLEQQGYNRISRETAPAKDARMIPVPLGVIWKE